MYPSRHPTDINTKQNILQLSEGLCRPGLLYSPMRYSKDLFNQLNPQGIEIFSINVIARVSICGDKIYTRYSNCLLEEWVHRESEIAGYNLNWLTFRQWVYNSYRKSFDRRMCLFKEFDPIATTLIPMLRLHCLSFIIS